MIVEMFELSAFSTKDRIHHRVELIGILAEITGHCVLWLCFTSSMQHAAAIPRPSELVRACRTRFVFYDSLLFVCVDGSFIVCAVFTVIFYLFSSKKARETERNKKQNV